MENDHKNKIGKMRTIMPALGIFAFLFMASPDSTKSIVAGFYADGYAVDLVMLAISIAFIAAIIILKLMGDKHKS